MPPAAFYSMRLGKNFLKNYKRPIESIPRDIRELKKNIKDVLLHEIGHYFGLSERWLEEKD